MTRKDWLVSAGAVALMAAGTITAVALVVRLLWQMWHSYCV